MERSRGKARRARRRDGLPENEGTRRDKTTEPLDAAIEALLAALAVRLYVNTRRKK